MQVRVNGQWQQRCDGSTVAQLLAALCLEPRRVAVERNQRIVRRADYENTHLSDRDELEIVTLVGGG